MKLMKKILAVFLSFLMVFPAFALDSGMKISAKEVSAKMTLEKAAAKTSQAKEGVVKKNYPTLPKGYEISQQFTYDTNGNSDVAYDGKSKKVHFDDNPGETRRSFFDWIGQDENGKAIYDGIKYDGAGFSFWYKSENGCTMDVEDGVWLYLDAAPEGRWVTYYYQGNIFYDNDVSKKVRYKTDMNPDIRAKINPDKKYNFQLFWGKGDYYIDEVFTFKAIKTDADKYENEEQAFKFSRARYDYQKKTSMDYIDTGDANGSVELTPAAGFNGVCCDVTYKMTEQDKKQFKRAVEIAQNGSGYLQITCDDIICKKDEEDYYALFSLTIPHTSKKINERTGNEEWVDKTLKKWINGSGTSETFLINANDITDFSDLSEVHVQMYNWGGDMDKVKFRLSPITVYHFPKDEIIIDTDWLKDNTVQNGEKIPDSTVISYDDGNDTNRKFLHVPNKQKSVTEITLPELPVGEYEVYANMRLNTASSLYTLAVNNRIQDQDKHFQLWIKNDNSRYTSHSQINNLSFGKIKITKDYKDGPTKLTFKSFYGSGTPCERTEMYISYLSFKKVGEVTAEPSDNFKVKDYPEPENYEKKRVLNSFDDFIRSDDNRYYKEHQINGYVGDKTGYNLNSRKVTGAAGMEIGINTLWKDTVNTLDGSALRFWIKFADIPTKESGCARVAFYGNKSEDGKKIEVVVEKSEDKYIYKVQYRKPDNYVIVYETGDYDVENGAWITIYYKDVVKTGNLSNIIGIDINSPNQCYVDELHTIHQKLGDILYEKNADGKSAGVSGYTFRIEDADISDTYEDVPVTNIKEGALSKSLTMNTVKLPSSVRTIEKNAFDGDMNLKSINLDNGVTTIEDSAFKDCQKLGEIKFSKDVTTIAENAFEGCEKLVMSVPYGSYAYQYAKEHNINYRTTLDGYDFYKIGEEIHIADYVGKEENVTVPQTLEEFPVTTILNGAFKAKSVKTVSAVSVTSVEKEAFAECPKLERASFAVLNNLDEKAFYQCKALKYISLGDKITTIGKNTFEGDEALVRITLPETLEEIDKTAFAGCSKKLVADVVRDSYAYTFVNTRDTAILQIPDTESEYKYSLWMYDATIIGYTGTDTNLELPKTIDDYPVVAVGENAFKGNENITTVAFPDKCKTVGDSAFYGCTKLSGFDINVVLQLGHHTFQKCPALKEIILTNVTKYWSDTFDSNVNITTNDSQFNRTAMELTNAWHAGINIGCHFDTFGYNPYGTFSKEGERNFCSDITQEYIKLLSDSGFDVVRFPITWTAFVDDDNNYKIDDEILDRIQEIVDWIIAEDMYVIINTHHDSSEYDLNKGWLNLANYGDKACKKFERIWEQVSERFKDYDEHLIFESLNEPRYGSEWDPKTEGSNEHLNDLQQRFLNVVRNSGGFNSQRYLMLETYAAAVKDAQCGAFVAHWKSTFQEDNHLMATVHFYNNNLGEGNFGYIMERCKKYFTDNNMACVMGESAVGVHSTLQEIRDNVEKKDAWVTDPDYYEETGQMKSVNKTVKARDYDNWYVSTWLDSILSAADKYNVKLIYWEDNGSQTLGTKGSNPWWYFPAAIDTFMNHEYNITVDGEKVTLKDLKFTLPEDEEVSYYTNGKEKFKPGEEVQLSQVKNKTEIVSVKKGSEPPATTEATTQSPASTQTPATTEATTQSPASTQTPATTEVTTQSPASTQTPATTEATTQSPVSTEKPPTTEKPASTEAPTTQKPASTEAPTTEKPVTTETPTTQKPASTEAPTTEKPVTTEIPTTQKPATTETPTTEKPVTTETPTTQKPVTTQSPATTETPSSKPMTPQAAPSVSETEKEINDAEKEEVPEGSMFNILRLHVAKTTKNSIKLKWKKVDGATEYIIYGNLCGKGNKYRKLKTVNGGSKVLTTISKLKKGKYYKFFVIAVGEYEGEEKALTVSKEVYAAVRGGKVGNYKAVKLLKPKQKKISIKQGKSYKVSAKSIAKSNALKVKKYRKICYESTDEQIAQVDSKGKIKAKAKGTCYIYIYNQTGYYTALKVTVK